MVELLCTRVWEKINRTDFYWLMLLMYTNWEHWNLFNTWYSFKIFVNNSIFFSFLILVQIYQNRYLKIFQQYLLISHVLWIFLNQNFSILLVNNVYIENIRTVCHRKLYIKSWYSSKSLWVFSISLVWFGCAKCFSTPKSKYVQVSKIFHYLQIVYY